MRTTTGTAQQATTAQPEATRSLAETILRQLGYDPALPPFMLRDREVALILQVKPSTLGNWRCTGRYPLPYTKVGRYAMYKVNDVAVFLENRRHERVA
ncbi:MAG: helix-turn-helix domain-containing protein [Prosthecobacter sp.]|nr:helix-turn-helix domain-containing protein [Prosthecobacter sp.]